MDEPWLDAFYQSYDPAGVPEADAFIDRRRGWFAAPFLAARPRLPGRYPDCMSSYARADLALGSI